MRFLSYILVNNYQGYALAPHLNWKMIIGKKVVELENVEGGRNQMALRLVRDWLSSIPVVVL